MTITASHTDSPSQTESPSHTENHGTVTWEGHPLGSAVTTARLTPEQVEELCRVLPEVVAGLRS